MTPALYLEVSVRRYRKHLTVRWWLQWFLVYSETMRNTKLLMYFRIACCIYVISLFFFRSKGKCATCFRFEIALWAAPAVIAPGKGGRLRRATVPVRRVQAKKKAERQASAFQ